MASSIQRGKLLETPDGRVMDPQLSLHITLAFLICQNFPRNPATAFTVGIFGHIATSQILAVVARDALEISTDSPSFDSLLQETDAIVRAAAVKHPRRAEELGLDATSVQSISLLAPLRSHFQTVDSGCAFLDILEKDVRDRVSEEDEYDATQYSEAIDRHSPIGLFLRELLLILRNLSFDQSAHVAWQVGQWLGLSLPGPSRLGGIPVADRRLGMEDSLDRRAAAMQDLHRAEARGDYSGAHAALRRFYDFPLPRADRQQHQHGSLNLATSHLRYGEMASARAALDEAIRVARSQQDKACLRDCMTLARRLQHAENAISGSDIHNLRTHQASLPTEKLPRADLPDEDLWSISAALDFGEPVHIAFRRLYLALAKHEHSPYKPGEETKTEKEKKPAPSGWLVQPQMHLAAWHATQAAMWSALGSDTLAEIHEEMALDDPVIDPDTSLFVQLQRSRALARHGRVDNAIGALLSTRIWRTLDHRGYLQWSSELAELLRSRAALAQDHASDDIVAACLPISGTRPSSRCFTSVTATVEGALDKAQKLRNSQAAPQIILPHVVSALQTSRELGMWSTYRSASVALAETMIAMESADSVARAVDVLQPVWTQIRGSGDTDGTARGALVMAKAKLSSAMDENDLETLPDGVDELLHLALASARQLSSVELEDAALQLLTLLLELRPVNFGLIQGDLASNCKSPATLNRLRQQTREICEVIKLVGLRISAGDDHLW